MKVTTSTGARTRTSIVLALVLTSAAGCGDAPPPRALSGTGGGTGMVGGEREAPPTKANITWKTMSKAERTQYMKDVVTPRMGEMFRAFDAKVFARFDCTTCHGQSAGEGSYTMPNQALATLPGNAMGFRALMHDKPEWMRFMGRQVRPQMAALLGLDEVDMRNPKPDQFGCRNCHTMLQQ